MPTPLEYMQISACVYAASLKNTIALPAGWIQVDWLPDQGLGFSAGVYRNDMKERRVKSFTLDNSSKTKPVLPNAEIQLSFCRTLTTGKKHFTGHNNIATLKVQTSPISM